MAVDLLDRLRVFWTREAIQKLSVLLGEHPDRLAQGLGLGAPTILAGLLRSVSGTTDADRLLHEMRREPEEMTQFGGISKLLEHLAGVADVVGLDPLVQHGRSELRSLFGDKLDGVIELIATDAGARPSTAGVLMSLASPTLMAMIRQQLGEHGLTVEGVRNLLASQRDAIIAQVPGRLAETLGFRSIEDFIGPPGPAAAMGRTSAAPPSVAVTTASGAAPLDSPKPVVYHSAPVAGEASAASSWWAIPLSIAVLAAAAGYYLLPQANPPETGPEVTGPTDMNPPAADPVDKQKTAPRLDGIARDDVPSPAVTADGRPVVATGGRQISMALPGDASIEVPEGSYLEAVIKTLRNGSAGDAQTFPAADLAFDQDSTLTTESARSVEQLAIIAKAYPRAKFAIEVRESPGGPDDADQRRATAQKRADAVRDALTQTGVGGDRVTAAVKPADPLDAPEATRKTTEVSVVVASE